MLIGWRDECIAFGEKRRARHRQSQTATALGIQAIELHRRKVRLFSTVERVNAREREKAKGKTG